MTEQLFAWRGAVPATHFRAVAALCVGSRSEYADLAGVEVYDKQRNARSFAGGMPIVAHPPCRAWSAYTAHQANVEPGEMELALLCRGWLMREGGVLEQPAHSRMFEALCLPQPGKRKGDLFTVEVHQVAWGYSQRKATWLCLAGIDPARIEWPFVQHDSRAGQGDRRRQQVMSKAQRSHTVKPLAEFLVALARLSAA